MHTTAVTKAISSYLPTWITSSIFDFNAFSVVKNINYIISPHNNTETDITANVNLIVKTITNILKTTEFVVSLSGDKTNASTYINLSTKILAGLVSSITVIALAVSAKHNWLDTKDIINLLLKAPLSLNLFGYNTGLGVGINTNKFNQNLELENLKRAYYNQFKTWGFLRYAYPDTYVNGQDLGVKLSRYKIPVQFPPKLTNLSKSNNYSAITSGKRTNDLFLYNGGSNLQYNLNFQYMASKNWETDNILGNKVFNSVSPYLNNKTSINNKNIVTIYQDVLSSFKEKSVSKAYEFKQSVLNDVYTKNFSNFKNKAITEYTLTDIYICFFRILEMMYPYLNNSGNTNRYYHPPLLQLDISNNKDLLYLTPSGEQQWFIVNSANFEFVAEQYDTSLGLSHNIKVDMNLTRVEKDYASYQYNLKNLIG